MAESNGIQKLKVLLSRTAFINYPLSIFGHSIGEFLRNRHLLLGMVVFQLVWLAAILLTGTSSNVELIVSLALYSLCAGWAIFLLPESLISKVTAFKSWLLHNQVRFLLLLSLVTILGGGFYASTQRAWGDEERSFRVAKLISAKGVEGAYQESGWLSKKHPPLIPILYSLTIDFTGSSLFHLRLVSVLFLVATLIATYYLGRELYDRDTGYLASLFFLSFPLVMRLGASAMMDMQLTSFFTLALLVSLRLTRAPSYWLAILMGVLIGFGLLTKYTMVLIFGILIMGFVFVQTIRERKIYFLLAFVVSISLFSGWLLYANHIGILTGQIEKIKQFSGIYYFFDNLSEDAQVVAPTSIATDVGNSASAIQNGILKLGLETLFTRLPSSLGVHNLPLILIGGVLLIKRREQSDIFILAWIAVVFGVLFLTLPDHRYFLPTFPAIAIMISQMFKRFPRCMERAILLNFLFLAANLYLFVNWVREAHLFL